MQSVLRPYLITVTVSALCVEALGIAGCAAKPPAPDTTAAASATAQAKSSTKESVSHDVPSTSSGPSSGSAQTAEERRADLDKRLNDSLGSFDAKLRMEQQKIAKERDARQASVATISNSDNGNSAAGAGTSADDSAGSRSGAPGDPRSDRTAGDLKSDKSSGNTNTAGNGAVAKEIPDGNDDDVVARRLRKAAEQETDPELKDKLWKEYVEYKKNTQGK
jgi:hypothetical protein